MDYVYELKYVVQYMGGVLNRAWFCKVEERMRGILILFCVL